MNFKELHSKFKDDDSPSVEGQIRWLQKQGFDQHQIEQAMISTYTEIERSQITFKKGFDLDQYLLNKAKLIRTEELTTQIARMEEFVDKLKCQAIEDFKKEQANLFKPSKPWYRRIFK